MKLPALLVEWPVALVAHGVAFAVLMLFQMFGGAPKEPLFKQEDVMMVSMSGPPKSDSRMVQRAERAPDAVRGAAKPNLEPPPPNQSDMAFKTPDAPDTKGQVDADLQRQKLLDDMKRQQLLKDLSAPIGTTNRAASDPNGSGDGSTASAGISDPETARWIKKMQEKVSPNWHPLISTCQANSRLSVIIRVPMAPTGVVNGDLEVEQSSGNASLDQSALRAVQQTSNFPPPPSKYADGVNGRVKFACADVI